MASSLPWVSSSVISSGSTWTITFPYVTNHLEVRTSAGAASTLAVGFTASGSISNNRVLLTSTTTYPDTFNQHIRITKVYLTALTTNVTASVFAGLTTIPAKHFPILTGSAPVSYDPTGSIYENYLSYDGLG